MALVDVDQIDAQMAVSRLTAHNRFAWATFDDRDHLGDPSQPLRSRVEADAARAGVTLASGPIYLLTHLRYLGYAFNPISFYFCCDGRGHVTAVMGEVHNTFGDQCTYWVGARSGDGRAFKTRVPKVMHVSPFMGMTVDYEFIVTEPGMSFVAHMNTYDQAEGQAPPYFDATLTLERRPWNGRELRRVLARHPWMTAKVIGAIHWEALRLWWKGLPAYANPGTAAARRDTEREADA